MGYLIHKVIHSLPDKDTIQLSYETRTHLCMNLYLDNGVGVPNDWKMFASEVGRFCTNEFQSVLNVNRIAVSIMSE